MYLIEEVPPSVHLRPFGIFLKASTYLSTQLPPHNNGSAKRQKAYILLALFHHQFHLCLPNLFSILFFFLPISFDRSLSSCRLTSAEEIDNAVGLGNF